MHTKGLSPYESSIKGVSVPVSLITQMNSKSKEIDKAVDESLNGVKNNLVKSDLMETQNVQNFLPNSNDDVEFKFDIKADAQSSFSSSSKPQSPGNAAKMRFIMVN